jgi:hypothetical protein
MNFSGGFRGVDRSPQISAMTVFGDELIVDKMLGQHVSGWWFGTCFLFFHILGIIIPTDFHIFQRGRYTTNQVFSGGVGHRTN